jgi:DNA-binding GntR family transcriptional regulator
MEINRSDITIRYEPGKARVCRAMGVPSGTLLMVLDRVSYSADGQPREHTLYYAQASSYEFSIRVHGPVGLVSNLKQTG